MSLTFDLAAVRDFARVIELLGSSEWALHRQTETALEMRQPAADRGVFHSITLKDLYWWSFEDLDGQAMRIEMRRHEDAQDSGRVLFRAEEDLSIQANPGNSSLLQSYDIRLIDGAVSLDLTVAAVNGTSSADMIKAHSPAPFVAYGGGGVDRLLGGRRDDRLEGGAGKDVIKGRGGEDTLHGDGGRDRIDAGGADDAAWGGGGADRILGRAGDDLLLGREGHDAIVGGGGADSMFGATGRDVLRGGSDGDTLDGGSGRARDKVFGGAGDDVFVESGGRTLVRTGGGRDLVEVFDQQRVAYRLVDFDLRRDALSLGHDRGMNDEFRYFGQWPGTFGPGPPPPPDVSGFAGEADYFLSLAEVSVDGRDVTLDWGRSSVTLVKADRKFAKALDRANDAEAAFFNRVSVEVQAFD
ncbi:MAG: calcium-binding protein, partial [Pseudomonadota bacterium]